MTVDRNGAKRDKRAAKARAQLDAFAENAELEEAENELAAVHSTVTQQTTTSAATGETSTPLMKR